MSESRQERDLVDRRVREVGWGPRPLVAVAVWDGGVTPACDVDERLPDGWRRGLVCVSGGMGLGVVRVRGLQDGGPLHQEATVMRLPDNPWPDRPGFRGWAGVWQGVLPAGGIVHVDAPWDWGSRERYRVAGILAGTRLVDDMVTRTIHGDHDRMVVDYVKPRVMEKILGVALVSNPKHWNWNGLWDPLLERTFSGWVRRLTVRMAKGCAKRVLRTRTKPFSAFERDDGSNPLQEHEDRRGVLVSPPRVVFTRPMDGERVRLARWARRRSGDEIVGRLQRDGWLPGDLDSTVDPGLLARFMVAPIPRDDRTRRVVLNALGSGRDERRLCGLWYESQVRLLTVGERDELWRLARSVAGSHGLLTPWRVFTVIAMSLYDI